MRRISSKKISIYLIGYAFFNNLLDNEVTCLVQPLTSYPPDLETLFYDAKSMGDLTQQTGETIFWSCMQLYVSKFADQYSKTVASMTTSQKRFLLDVLHVIRANIGTTRSRIKRQAESSASGRDRQRPRPVLRREIRILSERERADYFRAVNSLKMDTRLPPSIFDFMANFHSGDLIQVAHFGPGFPGWHRIFLYMYEFFLQLHVPWVTLPYWASVLDNEMTDARQSVLWSRAFMGSPVGQPQPGSGPFGNWTQINPEMVYERNVGFGPLYTWDDIRQILRRRRNEQILRPTFEPGADFEGIHGGPHAHVGGSMSRLNSAARDPIFYMHHAFVDMLWQEFRNRQRRFGINPATDYSFNATDRRFRAEHAPNAPMGFFRQNIFEIQFRQIDGLSLFFDEYIRYAPVPSCSRLRLDCGSPYLFCETNGRPRCVSRTIRDVQGLVDAFPIPPVAATGAATPGSTVARVRRSPLIPPTYAKSSQTCPAPPPVNDFLTREYSNGQKQTASEWVKIATRIIIKRPLQYNEFRDYSLYDYFSPERNRVGGLKQSLVDPGDQHVYRECDRKLHTIGTIKVVSYGLNYDGSVEEYALIDNRLGISDTTNFISVKRPRPEAPSEAIIAAFDSCGRVCQQYCLNSSMPRDRMTGDDMPRIGGGIRVTVDTPLQFGDNFAETTLSSWQIKGPNSCPTYDRTNAPITFFCDYSSDWFWPTGEQRQTILPEVAKQDVFTDLQASSHKIHVDPHMRKMTSSRRKSKRSRLKSTKMSSPNSKKKPKSFTHSQKQTLDALVGNSVLPRGVIQSRDSFREVEAEVRPEPITDWFIFI